jgi:electron transport complex protein RnfD
MWLVTVCAGLAVVQSSLGDSFASLILALCALGAALVTELLITWHTDRGSIRDGSAAASAMVLTLLLPNQIHPVYAVLGAIFAIALVKHSFGGLGSNWVNPAAAGWLFIRLSWPAAFEQALRGSSLSVISESVANGLSSLQGSPLGILKISEAGASLAASSLDSTLRSFLNATIFSITGAELPSGYIDLLFSRAPGIVADRGLAALLLGTIIITASQVSRAWIPAIFLAVYGLCIRVSGALPFGGTGGNGDVLFGFLSGGTIAAAFLLASDPVTGAKSNAGILITAALAGFFSWVFRYQGMEPYGAFFSILLINAVSTLMRGFEYRYLYSGKRRLFL